MTANFDISQAAPFADGGRSLVHSVKLNELNGVAESEFLHSGASSNVAVHLDDWHVID